MIAKKHAQQYMPNGEVSLEQVIQAAIDEAIAAYVNYPEYRDKNELQEHIRQLDFVIEQHKNHAIQLHERIRQLEYDKKIYLARAEASEADYARVVGRNRQLEAELDALRKDAERYRWLRMKGAHSDAVDKVHMLGPQLDAAIDAAIAGEKK